MVRIGIILAESALNDFIQLKDIVNDKNEFTFYTYKDTSEIQALYLQSELLHDAIIINQLSTMILQRIGIKFNTPTYSYIPSETDVYKKLFNLSLTYRNIDLSTVFLDYDMITNFSPNELANEMYEQFLTIFEANIINDQWQSNFYNRILDKHIQAHKSGKATLSVTTFSNIYSQLVKANIPTELITPSRETLVQFIEKIILEVSHQKLLDNKIVVGKITSDAFNASDYHLNAGYNINLTISELHEFKRKYKQKFIIQQNANFIEILISHSELMMLSHNLKSDPVAAALNESLSFNIFVGWGIDFNIEEAHRKAHLANHEAKIQKKCSVIINNTDQFIYLNSEKQQEVVIENNPAVQKLSEQTGISALILNKLLLVINKKGSNEITSDDIATHLAITVRSANRMLNELEAKGIAHTISTKHEKQRGRPKKVFKVSI
ncbi:hypothetical protein [Solibacillus daqui]|uniref:hypothetical protein n=1 Tax=Solibacillus daqui TaxID=2912187 RepID=UPI00236724E6|nr:hypothetical protein [Solibacillus daqui]